MSQATQPKTRRLLLALSNEHDRSAIMDLLGNDRVDVVPAEDGAGIQRELAGGQFDLLVLGWDQPDVKPLDLIDELHEQPALADFPISLYSSAATHEKGGNAYQAADADDGAARCAVA